MTIDDVIERKRTDERVAMLMNDDVIICYLYLHSRHERVFSLHRIVRRRSRRRFFVSLPTSSSCFLCIKLQLQCFHLRNEDISRRRWKKQKQRTFRCDQTTRMAWRRNRTRAHKGLLQKEENFRKVCSTKELSLLYLCRYASELLRKPTCLRTCGTDSFLPIWKCNITNLGKWIAHKHFRTLLAPPYDGVQREFKYKGLISYLEQVHSE